MKIASAARVNCDGARQAENALTAGGNSIIVDVNYQQIGTYLVIIFSASPAVKASYEDPTLINSVARNLRGTGFLNIA